MAWPVIAAAAIGAAASHINNKMQQREAQKAYDRQKKLLREEYQINQDAQRNAAKNNVFGMKAAGVNPALAADGNFAPAGASVPSAPMADVESPVSAALAAAQTQNVIAAQEKTNQNIDADIAVKKEQERKLKNEADIAKLTADRMRDADSGVNENMLTHLRAMRDSISRLKGNTAPIDKIIMEIENGERAYTLGSLEMNNLFEEYRRKHTLNMPAYSEMESNLKIADLKAKSPSYAKLVAALPEKESKKLDAEISKIYRDAYLAQSNGVLNEKKMQEIDANIKKTLEDARAIAQRAKSEYLRDPRMLINDEEYGKLATYIGMDVYEHGMDVLNQLITKSLPAELPPQRTEIMDEEVMDKQGAKHTLHKTRHINFHQPPKKRRR